MTTKAHEKAGKTPNQYEQLVSIMPQINPQQTANNYKRKNGLNRTSVDICFIISKLDLATEHCASRTFN